MRPGRRGSDAIAGPSTENRELARASVVATPCATATILFPPAPEVSATVTLDPALTVADG
jgi:hypothetical protein